MKFRCSGCGQKLGVEVSMLGTATRCPACHAEQTVPSAAVAPSMVLGGFVLERLIGVGGMGEVWLADQPETGRSAALKVLPASCAADAGFQTRFQQEIRQAARVIHPNLVTVFHAGCEDGIWFMAMEYVAGETLAERLRRGALPEAEAVRIAVDVARGLQVLWNKAQLIHRDIKPANIMLTPDGQVKVLDLGIARRCGSFRTLVTQPGTLMGTPHYLSPEQAEGRADVDCRTDMYALGIVLCEMLTGKPPFDAPDATELVAQHFFAPRPDLRQAGCSPATAAWVRRLIAVDRDSRFASWEEVLRAVTLPARRQPLSRAARRRWLMGTGVAAGLIVLAGVAALILHGSRSKPQQNEPESAEMREDRWMMSNAEERFDRLARDLDLTAEQQRKLREKIRTEMQARRPGMPDQPRRLFQGNDGFDRWTRDAELTPEQRRRLREKMRADFAARRPEPPDAPSGPPDRPPPQHDR